MLICSEELIEFSRFYFLACRRKSKVCNRKASVIMSSTHVVGKRSFLSKRFNNSKEVIGKDVQENVWLVLSLYKSARWLIRQ